MGPDDVEPRGLSTGSVFEGVLDIPTQVPIQSHGLFKAITRAYSDRDTSIAVSVDMLTASERYAAFRIPDDPVWAPTRKQFVTTFGP